MIILNILHYPFVHINKTETKYSPPYAPIKLYIWKGVFTLNLTFKHRELR